MSPHAPGRRLRLEQHGHDGAAAAIARAGQTMLGHSFLTTPGGKGANQAVAARRAGAEVVFVTAVGDDELGRESLELYRREGIDVGHARIVPGMSSGVALIFVADDGENMIGVASGANLALGPDDVDRLPASLFRAGDVLLAGLEIPVETARRALERGSTAGMLTILNPAPVPTLAESEVRGLLAAAEVITPNRVEALALAGIGADAASRVDAVAAALRLIAMGGRSVVVTLGADGCLVAADDDEPRPIPRAPGRGRGHGRGRRCLHRGPGRRTGRTPIARRGRRLGVRRGGAGRDEARGQAALPTRDAIDQLALVISH